jgi:hypothetical protein
VSAPFAPGVDAVSVLARHGVESCVDIAADSVERELAVRGTGRASVRRLTQLSGAGFWVSQGAVELAWEAFKGTDPRHAFKDDERELDGESVAEAESWYTAALRASELAAKLDGDIDFNSRPLRVDRPKRSAAWRIAFLKVATLHTLSSLCFEKWEETEFADASVVLDLLFAPAITGNDGPLSDADSPTVNGASIGALGSLIRHVMNHLPGIEKRRCNDGIETAIEEVLRCNAQGLRCGSRRSTANDRTAEDTLTYLPHESGHDDEKADAIDALDFVARLLAHVPDPRRHLVHYYGAYSNVVRGKLKARSQAQQTEPLAPGPNEDAPPPRDSASPSLAALRRGWAQLIRRVYEIDPLVCPRCRGVMRVVSFITEGRVIRRILEHLGASARRATQDRAPPPAAAAVPVSP